jgi:hypothetical protein
MVDAAVRRAHQHYGRDREVARMEQLYRTALRVPPAGGAEATQ